MIPDEPIHKQDAEQSIIYIKGLLDNLCTKCGKKVNLQKSSIAIYDDMRRGFRTITPVDLERVFNEIYTGAYGDVSEMKFYPSTINVCIRKYIEKNNVSAAASKKSVADEDSNGKVLNMWRLLEDEPNAKYLFPSLYVFRNGCSLDADKGYEKADRIKKSAKEGENISKCTCKDYIGRVNYAYKTTLGEWHCPFCDRRWEQNIFEGLSEDIDIFDQL